MTEQQWLASSDPAKMLAYLEAMNSAALAGESPYPVPHTSDRKLRLFACACARQVWDWLTHPDSRLAVEKSEKYAGLSPDRQRKVQAAMRRAYDRAYDASSWASRKNDNVTFPNLACNLANTQARPLDVATDAITRLENEPAVAALLRDIVGNPLRPVTLPHGSDCPSWAGPKTRAECGCRCDWTTPTVTQIAADIYDRRTWELCGVLADALEDAGFPAEQETVCNVCSQYNDDPENPFVFKRGHRPERDPASGRHEGGWTNCKTCNGGGRDGQKPGFVRTAHPLLSHLRSSEPHTRGCWALDLILGKE